MYFAFLKNTALRQTIFCIVSDDLFLVIQWLPKLFYSTISMSMTRFKIPRTKHPQSLHLSKELLAA